jgi:hypothetical protein
MMPNETRGRSFKGVLQYVLHDKRADGEAVRTTSERVSFVELANLPTTDPEKAFKLMAWTALHQGYLKDLTGQSARGRKAERPVWHVSLSWHPDEQEISPTDQAAAARDLLARFGLSEHQAVIAGHDDAEKGQAHLHIIANLVSPLTGKMPEGGLSFSQKALQGWARQYEKEHGVSFCPQREKRADEFDAALEKIETAAARNKESQKHAQAAFEAQLETLDYASRDDFSDRWRPSDADKAAQREELKRYKIEAAERRQRDARARAEKKGERSGERTGGGGKGDQGAQRQRVETEKQRQAAALKEEQAARRIALRAQQEREREEEERERRRRARAALDENFMAFKGHFKALYDERRAATWDIEKAIRRQKNLVLELMPDWARGMAGAVVDPAIRKLHQRPREQVEKHFEERKRVLKLAQDAERARRIVEIRLREQEERKVLYAQQNEARAALAQRHKAEWAAHFERNGFSEKSRPDWQRKTYELRPGQMSDDLKRAEQRQHMRRPREQTREDLAAEALKRANAQRDREAARAAEKAAEALRAAYGMAATEPTTEGPRARESLKQKYERHAKAESESLRAQFSQRAGQGMSFRAG